MGKIVTVGGFSSVASFLLGAGLELGNFNVSREVAYGLMAIGGLGLVGSWFLWRAQKDPAPAMAGPSSVQTTHGGAAPAIGAIHGDAFFNMAPSLAQPAPLPSPQREYRTWDMPAHEGPPERDVKLGEAMAYIIKREWGWTFKDAVIDVVDTNDVTKAMEDFRQQAYDRKLLVWGKLSWEKLYTAVSSSHWKEHDVEYFSLLRGEDKSSPERSGSFRQGYKDLMVNKRQIEKLWPTKNDR